MHRVDKPTETPAQERPRFTQRGICQRSRDRSTKIDLFFSVIDGYSDHKTGVYSALLAHFGFMSVFPLLAVMTTVLGFVLKDNEKLRETIVDSALSKIPIVGDQIRTNPAGISGSVVILVLGTLTSLWAGTRAFVAAQTAMNEIWELPLQQRPNLLTARLKALQGIGIVGLAQVGSGVLTGIIGVSGVSWPLRILLAGAALIVNTVMLIATYRALTARRLGLKQLFPGAALAGFVFLALQVLTNTIVARSLKQAAPVYGALSGVIALFAWLSLHATAALVGVEVNAALDRRSHPPIPTSC
jgi:membrane protein